MNITDLKNKKVAVLGLGVEGMATIDYLSQHQIKFVVLDEKLLEDSDEIKNLKQQGVEVHVGKDVLQKLKDFEIVFRTPGISPLKEKLLDAKEQGVIITSHTQFFLDNCPCQVIGVTGTKGKGTTSTLIYEMCKKQGFDVYIGGNIGKPPLEFLDSLNARSKVVLELSSFQLIDLTKSPQIAVLLMITSEHLDYHQDVYEYIAAKRNILRYQQADDYAVINRDYIASNESDIYTEAQVFPVSTERDGTVGCFIKNKTIHVVGMGIDEEVIKIEHILLPGKHNLENVCAAVMAATLAGVKRHNIATVLKGFKGLEHRLQLIRELNGVRYYDDSFSTTPETAIAAIEAFNQPEILILGGSSKNSDFTELGKTIRLAKNIKAIIGIGIEWERIKEQIGDLRRENGEEILLIEGAQNMEQIIKAANVIARPGDVVLLSPACASFGMFKNYKVRGEQFTQEVNGL